LVEFQEILDKIWFIPGKNKGRYPFANSLFINDRKTLLIDTGAGRRALRKLIKQFGQPDFIVYTHAHEDHISESKLFTTTSRFIHEKDKKPAESRPELLKLYGIDGKEIEHIVNAFFESMNYSPLKALKIFTSDHVFDLGSIEVKVIHAPGHSAGHSIFKIRGNDLIFSGDIDLSSFGPWYGAIDCDIRDFQESIKMVARQAPNMLVTSHKGVFTEKIDEHLAKFLCKIDERNEKILTFLNEPKTLDEIVSKTMIYGRLPEPPEFYEPAERIMVRKHLEFLVDVGKIEIEKNKYIST